MSCVDEREDLIHEALAKLASFSLGNEDETDPQELFAEASGQKLEEGDVVIVRRSPRKGAPTSADEMLIVKNPLLSLLSEPKIQKRLKRRALQYEGDVIIVKKSPRSNKENFKPSQKDELKSVKNPLIALLAEGKVLHLPPRFQQSEDDEDDDQEVIIMTTPRQKSKGLRSSPGSSDAEDVIFVKNPLLSLLADGKSLSILSELKPLQQQQQQQDEPMKAISEQPAGKIENEVIIVRNPLAQRKTNLKEAQERKKLVAVRQYIYLADTSELCCAYFIYSVDQANKQKKKRKKRKNRHATLPGDADSQGKQVTQEEERGSVDGKSKEDKAVAVCTEDSSSDSGIDKWAHRASLKQISQPASFTDQPQTVIYIKCIKQTTCDTMIIVFQIRLIVKREKAAQEIKMMGSPYIYIYIYMYVYLMQLHRTKTPHECSVLYALLFFFLPIS